MRMVASGPRAKLECGNQEHGSMTPLITLVYLASETFRGALTVSRTTWDSFESFILKFCAFYLLRYGPPQALTTTTILIAILRLSHKEPHVSAHSHMTEPTEYSTQLNLTIKITSTSCALQVELFIFHPIDRFSI